MIARNCVQGQLSGTLASDAPHAAVSLAVCGFPQAPPLPAPCARSRAMFDALHAAGTEGTVRMLCTPWELCALARAQSAGQFYKSTLKIAEFDVAIKAGKVTSFERMPNLKPFAGAAAALLVCEASMLALPACACRRHVPPALLGMAHAQSMLLRPRHSQLSPGCKAPVRTCHALINCERVQRTPAHRHQRALRGGTQCCT